MKSDKKSQSSSLILGTIFYYNLGGQVLFCLIAGVMHFGGIYRAGHHYPAGLLLVAWFIFTGLVGLMVKSKCQEIRRRERRQDTDEEIAEALEF